MRSSLPKALNNNTINHSTGSAKAPLSNVAGQGKIAKLGTSGVKATSAAQGDACETRNTTAAAPPPKVAVIGPSTSHPSSRILSTQDANTNEGDRNPGTSFVQPAPQLDQESRRSASSSDGERQHLFHFETSDDSDSSCQGEGRRKEASRGAALAILAEHIPEFAFLRAAHRGGRKESSAGDAAWDAATEESSDARLDFRSHRLEHMTVDQMRVGVLEVDLEGFDQEEVADLQSLLGGKGHDGGALDSVAERAVNNTSTFNDRGDAEQVIDNNCYYSESDGEGDLYRFRAEKEFGGQKKGWDNKDKAKNGPQQNRGRFVFSLDIEENDYAPHLSGVHEGAGGEATSGQDATNTATSTRLGRQARGAGDRRDDEYYDGSCILYDRTTGAYAVDGAPGRIVQVGSSGPSMDNNNGTANNSSHRTMQMIDVMRSRVRLSAEALEEFNRLNNLDKGLSGFASAHNPCHQPAHKLYQIQQYITGVMMPSRRPNYYDSTIAELIHYHNRRSTNLEKTENSDDTSVSDYSENEGLEALSPIKKSARGADTSQAGEQGSRGGKAADRDSCPATPTNAYSGAGSTCTDPNIDRTGSFKRGIRVGFPTNNNENENNEGSVLGYLNAGGHHQNKSLNESAISNVSQSSATAKSQRKLKSTSYHPVPLVSGKGSSSSTKPFSRRISATGSTSISNGPSTSKYENVNNSRSADTASHNERVQKAIQWAKAKERSSQIADLPPNLALHSPPLSVRSFPQESHTIKNNNENNSNNEGARSHHNTGSTVPTDELYENLSDYRACTNTNTNTNTQQDRHPDGDTTHEHTNASHTAVREAAISRSHQRAMLEKAALMNKDADETACCNVLNDNESLIANTASSSASHGSGLTRTSQSGQRALPVISRQKAPIGRDAVGHGIANGSTRRPPAAFKPQQAHAGGALYYSSRPGANANTSSGSSAAAAAPHVPEGAALHCGAHADSGNSSSAAVRKAPAIHDRSAGLTNGSAGRSPAGTASPPPFSSGRPSISHGAGPARSSAVRAAAPAKAAQRKAPTNTNIGTRSYMPSKATGNK